MISHQVVLYNVNGTQVSVTHVWSTEQSSGLLSLFIFRLVARWSWSITALHVAVFVSLQLQTVDQCKLLMPRNAAATVISLTMLKSTHVLWTREGYGTTRNAPASARSLVLLVRSLTLPPALVCLPLLPHALLPQCLYLGYTPQKWSHTSDWELFRCMVSQLLAPFTILWSEEPSTVI